MDTNEEQLYGSQGSVSSQPVVWLPDPWTPSLTVPPAPRPSRAPRCYRDCRASPVVLAVLAALLWGIAYSLPFWVTTPRFSEGFWGYCRHSADTSLFRCVWTVAGGHWINAAQGAFASGIVCCIVGIISGLVAFVCAHPVALRRFIGFSHILASILVLVSIVFYTSSYFSGSDITGHMRMLSVCFYAAVIGSTMNFIAGILYFLPLDELPSAEGGRKRKRSHMRSGLSVISEAGSEESDDSIGNRTTDSSSKIMSGMS